MAVVLLFVLSMSWAESSFVSSLQKSLKADPDLAQVDFYSAVVRAEKYQGLSRFIIPKLSFSVGESQQKNNISNVNAASKYQFATLAVDYDLFSFGSDLSYFQATRLRDQAQGQRVRAKIIEREKSIADLFFSYLRALKDNEITEKILALKEKSLNIASRRLKAGVLSREDYQKVKLDLGNAKAQLYLSNQTINDFSASLAPYEEMNLISDYPWKDELNENFINQIKEREFSLLRIPAYQDASLSLSAFKYENYSRLVDMFGDISFRFARNTYDFPGQERQWEWRTSLIYTLPLFDQFDQEVQRRRAKANKMIAEVNQRFNQKLVKKSFETYRSNLELNWKNWLERKAALKLSKKLYQSSLDQFKKGQLSVNELLIDQDRLFRTEQLSNEALYQLHLAILNMCHAAGESVVGGCIE